ncbi:MAG: hypothetical protein ACXABY_17690 [Candidatus Thorarchaeota archaeon]|jgi:hypothetical protein
MNRREFFRNSGMVVAGVAWGTASVAEKSITVEVDPNQLSQERAFEIFYLGLKAEPTVEECRTLIHQITELPIFMACLAGRDFIQNFILAGDDDDFKLAVASSPEWTVFSSKVMPFMYKIQHILDRGGRV